MPITLLILVSRAIGVMVSGMFVGYRFSVVTGILEFGPRLGAHLSCTKGFFRLLSDPFIAVLLGIFILFLFFSKCVLCRTGETRVDF